MDEKTEFLAGKQENERLLLNLSLYKVILYATQKGADMPSIHAISDLRNYTTVLRQVGRGKPVFLTKNGRGRFVLQDIADYEERQAVRRFGPYEKGSVTLDEVFGCLHRPGQPMLSVAEMDEAIGRAVCEGQGSYKAKKARKKPSP